MGADHSRRSGCSISWPPSRARTVARRMRTIPAPYWTPRVGDPRPCSPCRARLERVAPVEATVLLTGESGAGKGVAARRLHAMGGERSAAPFAAGRTALPCRLRPARPWRSGGCHESS
ncbi:sigma 54-interacting transcriptional regulator [Falsiroseomonas sp.]|uniref:sigma 54-interacting transcriptional regulator n=1 Tax=Falsiroseomonas sp. TaxID=2870721 RepID=UPI0035687599